MLYNRIVHAYDIRKQVYWDWEFSSAFDHRVPPPAWPQVLRFEDGFSILFRLR